MRTIKDIFRDHAIIDPVTDRHVNGTDKQSNHNYGDAYESLFQAHDYTSNLCPPTLQGGRSCPKCGSDTSHMTHCPDYAPKTKSTRRDVKLMMEVGVADGACLRAWREVFPNATIVGMDVHPSDLAHGDRIEFHLGDQRVKENCECAAAGRQFDLIVEDATHYLLDTLLTLFYLWPHVRPGGLYVVEEWENVRGSEAAIRALWPCVDIIGTCGPRCADEPLVVFRKPL